MFPWRWILFILVANLQWHLGSHAFVTPTACTERQHVTLGRARPRRLPLPPTPLVRESSSSSDEEPENKDDATPAVPRFFQALYRGLTFPFPTLRKLTLERPPPSSSTVNVSPKTGFSMREAVLAITVYLCLGAVSYHSTVLQAASDGGGQWSLVDALYFSVVTFTSVGYGDLTPTSTLGKVFTILFGMSGISILGIAIATIGSRMAEIEGDMVKKARQASRQRWKAFWHKIIDDKYQPKEGNEQSASTKTSTTTIPLWRQCLKSLLTKSVPAFAVIILGGTVMGRIEGWSLLDSCYYAFITAVTLGYGDYSPVTKAGRLVAIFFIPLAVAAAGEVLGNVATTLQERRQELLYKTLMQKELNVDRLLAMDTDRNGQVSREEYVEFMLQEMGLVSAQDLAELYDQFAKLDRDGSGSLDKDDLADRIQKIYKNH